MVVSLDVLPLALLEQVSGLASEESEDVKIDFQVTEMPPRFVVPFADVEVTEGSEVVFECVVTGTPVPVVQWFKGDTCVTTTSGKYVVSQKEGLHSLKVLNVDSSDGGSYHCQAINRLGEAMCKVFLKQVSDVEVWQGDVARLSVTVTGSPTPKILWFFNGVKLTPSADRKLVFDEGKYTCMASNVHGEAECSAHLHVQQRVPGAPCFARTPDSVQCAPGFTAVFEYIVAGEPCPNVEWFKGTKQLFSDARHSVAHHPDGSGSLTVWECMEEDTGLYTCRAVSTLGEAACSVELLVLPKERAVCRQSPALQHSRVPFLSGFMVSFYHIAVS
uniref:Ig-like domain-containing protein n=1 Tax=Anas zonorhyncha TaxID=75864 RepID=A0A8B9VM18_9AVES